MRLWITALLLAAAPFAHADEPWLARAFLPATNNIHGELRLLRRGDEACMQTLLYSRFLRRGLFEMTKQERAAWPEGLPGFADSTKYLADLAATRDAVLAAPLPDTNALHRLLIEFCITPTHASYAIGAMELEGPPDALRVVRPRFEVIQEAHPYYISRAMERMGERGFALPPAELQELLRAAGWRTAEAPEVPLEQRFAPR